MFKFDYEHFDACMPFIICIVPENWLSLKLPRFGGNVEYKSNESSPTLCIDSIFPPGFVFPSEHIYSEFVFEFCENAELQGTTRTISLEINKKHGAVANPTHKRIVGPVNMRSRSLGKNQVTKDWDVPVVLLNHLLGFIAGSVPVGSSWLDFGDVLNFLETHRELQFEFAGGNDYGKIASRLRGHFQVNEIVASFPMMYFSNTCRIADIEVVIETLIAKGDVLIYAPSVKGNQKFVSWLFA